MSLLSKAISNIYNGVSQQPAGLRDTSQATEQLNVMSSPSYGLRKRPGTNHVARMSLDTTNALVHFINRDNKEQYAVMLRDGDLKVFDTQTGGEIQVNKPNGLGYISEIDPQADLRVVSVADYTFVLNTKRPVQLNAKLFDETDKLEGVISFPIPTSTSPVVEPPDGSASPAPGTGGGGSLPIGGGGGGWPGGSPGDTGGGGTEDPEKPEEPEKPEDKEEQEPSITVSLASATLYAATVNVGYPPFDFKPLLTITGDSGSTSQATFSMDNLPPGMVFSAGRLSGTPTALGSFSITVTAQFKGVQASKGYQLLVQEVKKATSDSQVPSGWAEDTNQDAYYYELPRLDYPIPPYLGDGGILDRLTAQGMTKDHFMVLYTPALTFTVRGDSTAEDLSKYYPIGLTTYGGSGGAETLGLLAQNMLAGLTRDGYLIKTNATKPYQYNNSFPMLVVGSGGSRSTVDAFVRTEQHAVFYAVPANDVTTPVKATVLTALSFDARFFVPVMTPENQENNGPWTTMELPVRVSISGLRPVSSPSDGWKLNLDCGRVEDMYGDGRLLTTSGGGVVFINGFTREHNRFTYTSGGYLVGTPSYGLKLTAESTAYDSNGTTLYYPGVRFTFTPPPAYAIVSKNTARKSQLGSYTKILGLGSKGLVELSAAEMDAIPN